MAKVLNIPTRGSIGNVVHSANRSGQIQRARAIPSQPRTAAQTSVRSRLGTLSAAWRGLTDAQRAAWNAFANSFTVTNSLGTSGNMTGHQAYVKVNATNLLNGDATVATPPTLPAFVAVTATGIDATAGTPLLEISGATPTTGTKHMVFASPQLSPGVTFNNKFAWILTGTTYTAGKLALTTAYTAKYGAPIAGKRIMVKVVQSQAGMQDNGTTFQCIVGA